MDDFLELFGVMMAIFIPISMLILVSSYTDNKRTMNKKMAALRVDMERNSKAELEKELENLRERIVVLEQIVTDSQYELSDKIRKL